MKHIVIAIALLILSQSNQISAYSESLLRSRISSIGCAIENIQLSVPVIGKVTNLLPIALLVTGLKECPLQTAMAFCIASCYVLYRNQLVRDFITRYGYFDFMNGLYKRIYSQHNFLCDDIFIFDEECQEIETNEDGLLGMDLLSDQELEEIERSKKQRLSTLLL